VTSLPVRVEKTQLTVERFRDQPFAWGQCDCARLAAFHLKQFGVKARLVSFGPYRSAAGAGLALRRKGFADLADVADKLGLKRIAPAAALVGDLMGFRHPQQELGVVMSINLGNGRALGFMDNGDGVERCYIFPPVMNAEGVEYLAWGVC
jgi:hypothetical protein